MNEGIPVEEKKPSLFRRAINLIYSIWPKTDETDSYRAISLFRIKAEDMIPGTLPEHILHAAMLYEEALKIARRRITVSTRITSLEDSMRDIEAIARLTPDESRELSNLLQTFLSVTRDRNVLRYQLTDFDKGVDTIANLEEDASLAIPKIQDSERMNRILKRDVGMIEGEKADLEYEREKLFSGMSFTGKLTVATVSVLALTAIVLVYFAMILHEPMFYPATALAFIAIFILFAILMFRRKIIYELKLNARMQQRAVELMNKKVAVLAHHTNFLNFAYKKYKVRSSQALIKNLSEYDRYKHVTSRLDSIRDIMYETERRIEQFLRDKGIEGGRFSIEQFARNMDIEDRQRYYKQLSEDLGKQELLLHELDTRHSDIWDYLEDLRAMDETDVIEALSQMYIDEVAQILGSPASEEAPDGEGGAQPPA